MMQDIIAALKTIQEHGSFCAKRTAVLEKLAIEIKGFGRLQFPFAKSKAKALIELAQPSQFGWQDKTLMDKAVRDGWEIAKNQIKIGKEWDKELQSTLDQFKKDLGLPETAALKASLHNLLIYERGQFFSPHQDSEKIDGMVATLVVVLPSEHSGGELIIDHQGVKKKFSSSQFSLDKLTCIAFYADCHHEVKKVTSGYRIALTYNLILENPRQKIEQPSPTHATDQLVNSLRAYFSDKEGATKADYRHSAVPYGVYLLDHYYTQKGLSWNHLKNTDRLRAEALKTAADLLGLEIHLTLADVQETWLCEEEQDFYSDHYRDYYDDDNEEEEDEEYDDSAELDEDDLQLGELLDSSVMLKHWVNRENKSTNYQEYSICIEQMGWTKDSDEFKPFQSEYEGWMGNYGNTAERWYHRSAIIFWRQQDHYPMLFDIDGGSVMRELLQFTQKDGQQVAVCAIIHSLLPYWQAYLQNNRDVDHVFKLALYVKDASLAQILLTGFNAQALTPENTLLFLELNKAYGTDWSLNILQLWTTKKERYEPILKLKHIAQIVKHTSQNTAHRPLSDWLLTYQLKSIQESNAIKYKNDYRVERLKTAPERVKEGTDFFQACVIGNHSALAVALMDYLVDNLEFYSPLNLMMMIDDGEKILPKNSDRVKYGYQKLWNHVYRQLNSEKERGLRASADWSIIEKLSCTCDDCATLDQFLKSRTKKTLTWPLSKERRRHIHNALNSSGIPVTHETQHIGSPHKLILTKTKKLHEEAKQQFTKVEKALLTLNKKSHGVVTIEN